MTTRNLHTVVLAPLMLICSCEVEPTVQPWLDGGCELSDGCSGDGGIDAGECSIAPPDVMACDAVVPIGSDASLDPGDASCIHPPVVEDCVDGWCRIPAGCFTAGAPEDAACRARYTDDQVQVFITHPFLIMQTEVTQAMWVEVGFPNPVKPQGCPDCPVNLVNLYEAFAYANALSEMEGLERCYDLSCCSGMVGTGCPEHCSCLDIQYMCPDEVHRYARRHECPGYRLPTGPEWEYAARAGTTTATYNGDMESSWGCVSDPVVDPIAWHCGNTDRPMPVGLLEPNGWGLHDMLGNVRELVDYRYDGWNLEHGEGRSGPLVDPVGPGVDRAWGFEVRGGAYVTGPCFCGATFKLGNILAQSIFYGFRVVRTLHE